MHTQIKKWGNSQGVRLSKEVLEMAGFSESDVLNVTVSKGVILLTKGFRHKTLEERTAEFGEKIRINGEYDWGDPEGGEVW